MKPRMGLLHVFIVGVLMLLIGVGLNKYVFKADYKKVPIKFNTNTKATPTEAPTPTIAKTIITSAGRTGWTRFSSEYSNLSISYPNTWRLESSVHYDSETVQIISPSSFVLRITTGIYGIGGGCDPEPLDKISFEKIKFMGQDFYLRLIERANQEDSITAALLLTDPQQCTNMGFLSIKNLGTNGGFSTNDPHSGAQKVVMFYKDGNDKSLVKTKDQFQGTDYQVAKEILSTAEFYKK